MQMSCINSNEPQAIQSMNPVALGLMVPASPPLAQMGMMMMMAPDPSIFNPAQMALLHNGQNQLYQSQQQQQLNHHGIMAMAGINNQVAGQQQGLVPFERASSSGPSDTQNQLYQQQLNLHASMVMAAMHNQAGQQQQQQGGGISERASSSGPSRTSTDVSSSTEAVAALNQGQGNPPVAMSASQMQLQQLAASSELYRAPQGGAPAGANGDQDGVWSP
jgi:hypothetical protein